MISKAKCITLCGQIKGKSRDIRVSAWYLNEILEYMILQHTIRYALTYNDIFVSSYK